MSQENKCGIIYSLVHVPTETVVYIGSTINSLRERWNHHKVDAKMKQSTLYKFIRLVGIHTIRIELIETYPYEKHDELFKREQYYIQLYDKPLCNSYRAYAGPV